MWLKYINEALTGTSNATNFRPYINDLTLAVQKALVHFAPIERADYENNPFQLIDFFSGAGGTSLGFAALNAMVDNVLGLDYEALIDQLPAGYQLEHSRSAARNPYDEEAEEFVVRAENMNTEIRVYCPLAVQKFTIAGYNVIKDCWLKFHSYRFTHCEFTREDFRELLDLFNKIASQMQLVEQVDEILHDIVSGDAQLFTYEE